MIYRFIGGRVQRRRPAARKLSIESLEDRTLLSVVSFQNPVNYGVGSSPTAVAVGDFAGNGKLDLAVANQSSGSVSVLLGNGDGTFQSAATYSVGTNPTFVVTADFNHDGKIDLAVANQGSGSVSVLLGNGDGTFHRDGFDVWVKAFK